jgi:hypothetical protein
VSHDLYFLEAVGRSPLTFEQFHDYFNGRAGYASNPDQAMYEDPATGCHFSFAFAGADAPKHDDLDVASEGMPSGYRMSGASFNLNYNRPFWYVDVAEPEVRAFVERFDVGVMDPQSDLIGDYDRERFRESWRAANRWAISAVGPGEAMYTAPAADVAATVRWNAAVGAMESSMGPDIFVPTIAWLARDGQAERLVTWWAGGPTVIPDVEWVMVGMPAGLVARLRGRQDSSVLLPLSAAEAYLESRQEHPLAGGIRFSRSPVDAASLMRVGTPVAEAQLIVPPWQVFEREEVR